MANENKQKTGPVYVADSVNGISSLKPTTLQKSIVGAAVLKPATPQSSQNSTTGTTQNTKPVTPSGSNQK